MPLVNVRHTKAYDVYIGRGKCPKTGVEGIYGNPFSHMRESLAQVKVSTRKEAVQAYEAWLRGLVYKDLEQDRRQKILESLPTLRNATLGCWCWPLECHGYILLKMAEEV